MTRYENGWGVFSERNPEQCAQEAQRRMSWLEQNDVLNLTSQGFNSTYGFSPTSVSLIGSTFSRMCLPTSDLDLLITTPQGCTYERNSNSLELVLEYIKQRCGVQALPYKLDFHYAQEGKPRIPQKLIRRLLRNSNL